MSSRVVYPDKYDPRYSHRVRVNAVAPSLTSTDATAEIEKSEALIATFREWLPLGRHTR
jgi:NAD(P)-dependent dehydrogenase (short-subunit alcohol dehydrogenase family)